MDESLNNEDPDILLSKLQKERVERVKKEKSQALPVGKSEKKIEKEPEVKSEKNQVKHVPLPKAPSHMVDDHTEVKENQEKSSDAPVQNVFRGRGGPRGFGRGYRGGRGFAPRSQQGDFSQNGIDSGSIRDTYEARGRERFRPRGGFYRGRAANTDVRELPADSENANHDRHASRNEESQSAWDSSPAEQELSGNKSSAPVDTDNTSACVESQDAEQTDGKEDEEEAHTYTLEEYKAMRSQEKPAVTLTSKGSRKPNDGEDVFANMVAHRKIVEVQEDEYVKVEMEEEQPNKIEINVLFNDDLGSRGRQTRGFGNRGFPRGGRPRGRPRMDRGGRGTFRGDMRGHRGTPCVIYNDQEFPSLK